MLGLPIGWVLAIGQAQAIVTLLLTLGNPWAVALAGHLKLFPFLVGPLLAGPSRLAEPRLVRRLDGRASASSSSSWSRRTRWPSWASRTSAQVGDVHNFSPYALSPLLWGVLVVVGVAVTLRLGRTRWGWSAAVALSVLATPRLLTYMLMTLLACLRRPDEAASDRP